MISASPKLLTFLLRLKPWQLFILIVLPLLFPSFNSICEVINLFGYIVYIAWIYAVGRTMHSMLPERLKPPVSYFIISCFSILIILILPYFFNLFQYDKMFIFWVLFIYVMGCAFYSFSFAARMLESMIEGEIIGFSDSLKGFLGFWFFPIGLWYIQPAVQRVLDKYELSDK